MPQTTSVVALCTPPTWGSTAHVVNLRSTPRPRKPSHRGALQGRAVRSFSKCDSAPQGRSPVPVLLESDAGVYISMYIKANAFDIKPEKSMHYHV